MDLSIKYSCDTYYFNGILFIGEKEKMKTKQILLLGPLAKAFIKQTTVKTKSGKTVIRRAHTDKRKSKTEHIGARQKIEDWVKKEFNPKYVEKIITDLIDVASGNREGNEFEKRAVKIILKDSK